MQKKMARIDEMEKELERMHDLEDKLNELQGRLDGSEIQHGVSHKGKINDNTTD